MFVILSFVKLSLLQILMVYLIRTFIHKTERKFFKIKISKPAYMFNFYAFIKR